MPNHSEPRVTRRGKYTRLSDVFALASKMQELESPARMKFLINGKPYAYSEMMRRLRRAQKSGIFPPEKSQGLVIQPGHIEIVPKQSQCTQRSSIKSSTADCANSLKTYSTLSQTYANFARSLDTTLRAYFLELVALEEGATILLTLRYPDEHMPMAKFYFNLIRYIQGAFDNKHYVPNESYGLVSHVSARSSANVSNFHKCCLTAIDLLDRAYWTQGFALISRCLWLVEPLLEERDPKLNDTICDVAVLLLTKGWTEVYEVFINRVSTMIELRARRTAEELHPWTQMYVYLRKIPTKHALEHLRRGWRCGFDQLEGIIPGNPWDGLNMACSSKHALRMGGHVARVNQHILQAWHNQQQLLAPGNLQQQFSYGKALYSNARYREALEVLGSVSCQCTEARSRDDKRWLALEIEILEALALCNYASRMLDCSYLRTAEAVLQDAISRSIEVQGMASATTIALRHTLWAWLLDQGRCSEAEMLRMTIDAVVVTFEP
jgi:hypothetical protein